MRVPCLCRLSQCGLAGPVGLVLKAAVTDGDLGAGWDDRRVAGHEPLLMAVGEVHHRPVGRVDVPGFDLPADEGYPQVQPRDGAPRVRNPQWPGAPGRDVAVEHWLTPDDVVLIEREPSSVIEQQHAERRA